MPGTALETAPIERSKVEHGWRVILYNDDVHDFDEVILQLQRAAGHSLEKATAIAYEVDRVGRAVCYEGTREDCQKVAAVLRQIALQVEVDH
jgi:ATP-dependent Clp protease adapter protein ClpS